MYSAFTVHKCPPPSSPLLPSPPPSSPPPLPSPLLPPQLFPSHYHPAFITAHLSTRQRQQSTSGKKGAGLFREEDETDRLRYGGHTGRHSDDPFVGPYAGHHAWTNRFRQLSKRVGAFRPKESRPLSLFHASNIPHPSAQPLSKHRNETERSGDWERNGGTTLEPCDASKPAWYEEPISHQFLPRNSQSRAGDFTLPFATGFKGSKSGMGVADPSEGGSDPVLSPLLSHYHYLNRCLLPSAAPCLGSDAGVVHVAFDCGAVVVYYGRGIPPAVAPTRSDSTSDRSAALAIARATDRLPVVGVAVYQMESKTYSCSRSGVECVRLLLAFASIHIHVLYLWCIRACVYTCMYTMYVHVYVKVHVHARMYRV